MAQLPAANYLSDSARTEAEMQTALESLRDVIAEMGSQNPRTLNITSGELEAPTSHFAWARSEGHSSGADDVLDTIDTAGIDQGRLLILRNYDPTSSETANTERITINHGTGVKQMELSDSTSFLLCGERMIAFVYSGTRWIELWRSYHRRNAEDVIAERTHLGLGDAATETIATSAGSSANDKVLKVGSSANLTANDLLAIDGSGNIVAGSVTGGNADTLDTYDSTAFLRKADTATHTIAANLNISTSGSSRFIANTNGTSQTPGLQMEDNGTTRALMFYDGADGSLDIRTLDAGGTMTPTIRLNPTNDRLEFATGAGASWQSLRPGPGNGLDADTLDGVEYSAIQELIRKQGLTWYLSSDVTTGATEKVREALPATFDIFSGLYCDVTFRFVLTGTGADIASQMYLYLDSGISVSGSPTTDELAIAEISSDNWLDVSSGLAGYKTQSMVMPSSLDSILIENSSSSGVTCTLATNGSSLSTGTNPLYALWNNHRTSVTIRALE